MKFMTQYSDTKHLYETHDKKYFLKNNFKNLTRLFFKKKSNIILNGDTCTK